MTIDFKKIQIDEELEDLLPGLSEDDSNSLTQSLIENGFDQKFGRIKVWFPEDNDGTGYIVDGHNRYKICRKNDIELSDYCFEPVYFDSKEEVIKWMLENQLARRNLQTIQRIAIAEKYRPIFERQAKANQSLGGGDKRSENYQKSAEPNLAQAVDKKRNLTTDEKLSKISGVKKTTYKMGAKVLKSGSDDLKQRVLSGKISISSGYRELRKSESENLVLKKEKNNTPEQRIIEADNRMNEIDRKIADLKNERENLMRKRSMMFEALDIECELKYEFFISDDNYLGLGVIIRKCRFYIEKGEKKQIFVECGVYPNECPNIFYIDKIPGKYKNDFLMLWKKAYQEDLLYKKKIDEENEKKWQKKYSDAFKKIFDESSINKVDDESKIYYKKFYRVLATVFHPDSPNGDAESMKYVNGLKELWGV